LKNFWRKRMGGDRMLSGEASSRWMRLPTIVGVLRNMPFSWVGPAAEV